MRDEHRAKTVHKAHRAEPRRGPALVTTHAVCATMRRNMWRLTVNQDVSAKTPRVVRIGIDCTLSFHVFVHCAVHASSFFPESLACL